MLRSQNTRHDMERERDKKIRFGHTVCYSIYTLDQPVIARMYTNPGPRQLLMHLSI